MSVTRIVRKCGVALLVSGLSLLLLADPVTAQDPVPRDTDPGAQQTRQIRRAAGQQARERERDQANAESRGPARDPAQRLEQLESKLDTLLREVRQLRQEIRRLSSDVGPRDDQGRLNPPRRRGGPAGQRPNRNRFAPQPPVGPRPGFVPPGPGFSNPSFGPQPRFAPPFQGPPGAPSFQPPQGNPGPTIARSQPRLPGSARPLAKRTWWSAGTTIPAGAWPPRPSELRARPSWAAAAWFSAGSGHAQQRTRSPRWWARQSTRT